LASIALLLACATLGACVHRPYIQQGNYLEIKDVDQVTTGMTRSQVRYLLGTPMISDPFTAQRWDYIYTLKRGRQRKIDRAHFVVYFADEKVERIERLDLPDGHAEGLETGLPEVERSEEEMAIRAAEREAERQAESAGAPTDTPQPDEPASDGSPR
jgi:outer membrane protein assembly factor BamE